MNTMQTPITCLCDLCHDDLNFRGSPDITLTELKKEISISRCNHCGDKNPGIRWFYTNKIDKPEAPHPFKENTMTDKDSIEIKSMIEKMTQKVESLNFEVTSLKRDRDKQQDIEEDERRSLKQQARDERESNFFFSLVNRFSDSAKNTVEWISTLVEKHEKLNASLYLDEYTETTTTTTSHKTR